MIFAIAAALDLEIEQMDVKTAFLYGDIDDEVLNKRKGSITTRPSPQSSNP